MPEQFIDANEKTEGNEKQRSLWREFSFMLHRVQEAIMPDLGLENTVNNWWSIIEDLATEPRKRSLQPCYQKIPDG